MDGWTDISVISLKLSNDAKTLICIKGKIFTRKWHVCSQRLPFDVTTKKAHCSDVQIFWSWKTLRPVFEQKSLSSSSISSPSLPAAGTSSKWRRSAVGQLVSGWRWLFLSLWFGRCGFHTWLGRRHVQPKVNRCQRRNNSFNVSPGLVFFFLVLPLQSPVTFTADCSLVENHSCLVLSFWLSVCKWYSNGSSPVCLSAPPGRGKITWNI